MLLPLHAHSVVILELGSSHLAKNVIVDVRCLNYKNHYAFPNHLVGEGAVEAEEEELGKTGRCRCRSHRGIRKRDV